MYCKHRKYRFLGPCLKFKRICLVRGCSYFRDKWKRKRRDKRKRDKAIIIKMSTDIK